jgi:hypothetical protein
VNPCTVGTAKGGRVVMIKLQHHEDDKNLDERHQIRNC